MVLQGNVNDVTPLSGTVAVVPTGYMPGGPVSDEQIARAVEEYMIKHPVSGSGGLSGNAANLLVAILGECGTHTDQSANIAALKEALMESANEDSSGGDSGGNEDVPTVTGISAVFNGTTAPAGTYASDLDITVTAEYSDGSTAIVTDYTISGQVAMGENILTIIYGGKSCTVTVVGVLAPDWSVYDHFAHDALSTGLTPFASDQSFTILLDVTNVAENDTTSAVTATLFNVGTSFSATKRKNYNLEITANGNRVLGLLGSVAYPMVTNDRMLVALTHTAGNNDLTVDARIVKASGENALVHSQKYTVEGWISDTSVMTAMSEYYGNRLFCRGAEVYMNHVADADMVSAWLARGDS